MAGHQVLLYGDSHSEAVFQAAELRERKGKPTSIGIYRARREKGDLILGDTSFEAFVQVSRRLADTDVIISMIGGNQHAVFSTIQHPIAFDVLEPGANADSMRPAAQLIPYRAISSSFHAAIRGRDGLALKTLRGATRARMVHLVSPPPKRDSGFILKHNETRFRDDIAKLGVSPPELRMKIWRMQRNLLHDFCNELGIEALDPPPAALDADGFLLPEYYKKDVTHANRGYGILLLAELERRFVSKAKGIA